MATGGSGDALTGIIAAFIAQGMEPYVAACLGVYVHGLAGDAAAKEKGTYSLMAGDIISSIEKVLINLD
jgi:NAD(P)H-hydrate epimerase